MHVQAYDFIERHAATLRPARVLEIGSLDVNGSVRPLFPTAKQYHGIDIAPGPGVDEVADASTWHASTLHDVVVSTEVLEHAPRWRDVVTNAWNALDAGGVLLMTCATEPRAPHSAIDGWEVRPDEWYANVPPADALALIQTFEPASWQLEVALERGDLYFRVDKPAR